MILSGTSIQEQYQRGKININPFQHGQVTTNSYDLTLGASFLRYTCRVLDPRKANPYETLSVGDEGLLMKRGDFILGHSREIIGSDSFVPLIHAKSSIARLGLFVHVTADLVDIGFHGNITFQLGIEQVILQEVTRRRALVSDVLRRAPVEIQKYSGGALLPFAWVNIARCGKLSGATLNT